MAGEVVAAAVAVDTRMEEDNNGELEEVEVPGHKGVVVVKLGVEPLPQEAGAVHLPPVVGEETTQVEVDTSRPQQHLDGEAQQLVDMVPLIQV